MEFDGERFHGWAKELRNVPRLPLDRSKCECLGWRIGVYAKSKSNMDVIAAGIRTFSKVRDLPGGNCLAGQLALSTQGDVSEMDSANAWPGTDAHLEGQGLCRQPSLQHHRFALSNHHPRSGYKGPRAPWCSV